MEKANISITLRGNAIEVGTDVAASIKVEGSNFVLSTMGIDPVLTAKEITDKKIVLWVDDDTFVTGRFRQIFKHDDGSMVVEISTWEEKKVHISFQNLLGWCFYVDFQKQWLLCGGK